MAATSASQIPLESSIKDKAPSAGLPAGKEIRLALEKLDLWIEGQSFRGWDPHDALNSRLIRQLTLQNRLAGIFWLQLLKRSPVNLRNLLAIPKAYNPKGMGLFLASYVRKLKMTGDAQHQARVCFLARWHELGI